MCAEIGGGDGFEVFWNGWLRRGCLLEGGGGNEREAETAHDYVIGLCFSSICLNIDG
jgi:hypothetical protein